MKMISFDKILPSKYGAEVSNSLKHFGVYWRFIGLTKLESSSDRRTKCNSDHGSIQLDRVSTVACNEYLSCLISVNNYHHQPSCVNPEINGRRMHAVIFSALDEDWQMFWCNFPGSFRRLGMFVLKNCNRIFLVCLSNCAVKLFGDFRQADPTSKGAAATDAESKE
jgi:hypothetical protein